VDEEIYEGDTGLLIHTIGQLRISDGMNRFWHLKAGKYRAYGVSDIDQLESSDLVGLRHSSSSTFQTPPPAIKVELDAFTITLLSDDSDTNSLDRPTKHSAYAPNIHVPSSSFPQHTKIERPTSNSITLIFNSLKGIRGRKGCRNALSKIDYDTIPIHTVPMLPPNFKGNIIFELPKVDSGGTPLNVRQMAGMDKRYDGHV